MSHNNANSYIILRCTLLAAFTYPLIKPIFERFTDLPVQRQVLDPAPALYLDITDLLSFSNDAFRQGYISHFQAYHLRAGKTDLEVE
jgi:hypothetical protein